jgi:hypothetical protein
LTSARRPLWLKEGLATYFETVAYDVDRHEVAAGRPPDSSLRAVLRGGLLDSAEMRATKRIAEDRTVTFYATAWFRTVAVRADARRLPRSPQINPGGVSGEGYFRRGRRHKTDVHGIGAESWLGIFFDGRRTIFRVS